MDTERSITLLCAALAAALFTGPATAAEMRTAKNPIDGRYIVVLKRDEVRRPGERSSRPDVVTLALELGATHRFDVDVAFEHAIQGFTARASRAAMHRLLTDPRVEWVEEDGRVTIAATQSAAPWGLDRTDQRDRPLDTRYSYSTAAANVHAYVIDTGIRGTHADFGGRVAYGYTAIDDGRGTADCNGHGTHVAGTIGGATHGVAKGVVLHPIRVLDCEGSGSNSGVIAGVDWVTAHHVKPAVANMSLGGAASSALDTAVANSIMAGVVYTVAAGNDNANACLDSPGRVGAALTVGSSTNTDARSSFSNWGTCLDLFAPGSSITSAWHTGDSATMMISGTSMAAPHVAGVAALHLAGSPAASPSQVAAALVGDASVNKVTTPGTGSPNRLLYSRFGLATPADAAPVASFTYSCTGTTCSFNAGASTDDRGIAAYAWSLGDGTTASGVTTTRSYPAPGTFTVTLTVRDTAGQTATQARTIAVGSVGGALQNGVPMAGLTATTGQMLGFTMSVPTGSSTVRFEISGGTGDADLYVKYGSAPTTTAFDCRPYLAGNTESCTINTPAAGTWHVGVRAYSSFSNVTLKGTSGSAQRYFENGTNFPVADLATVESPIAVTNVYGNAPSALRVGVDIKHTYIGDLKVDLVAPDGSVYVLHNRTGAGTDNLIGVYTVNASSEVANGRWKLRVNDGATADTGYVDKWTLQF